MSKLGVCVIAVALAMAAAVGARAQPAGEAGAPAAASRYAVVIGINTYHDPAMPPLKFCEGDARAMHALLTDAKSGGVPAANATLLLGKEATTRAVKSALNRLRQAPKDSTVFVYFSGHGAKDGGDGYLATYDALPGDLASTAVSDLELKAALAKIASERIVLMLDCCYAAALMRDKKAVFDGGELIERFTGKGLAVLSAAGPREEAIEAADLKRSVFTHFLLEGMSGKGDANRDGAIVLTELTEYVDRMVAEEARRRGGVQRPVVDLKQLQEPSRFLVTADSVRLAEIEKEKAAGAAVTKARVEKLRALFMEERITAEQFNEGRRLLEAPEAGGAPSARRVIYAELGDGTLNPAHLAAVLAGSSHGGSATTPHVEHRGAGADTRPARAAGVATPGLQWPDPTAAQVGKLVSLSRLLAQIDALVKVQPPKIAEARRLLEESDLPSDTWQYRLSGHLIEDRDPQGDSRPDRFDDDSCIDEPYVLHSLAALRDAAPSGLSEFARLRIALMRLDRADERDAAAAELSKLLDSMRPEIAAQAAGALGRVAYARRDFETAARLLRRAADSHCADAATLVNLAWVLSQRLGRHEEAVPFARTAVRLVQSGPVNRAAAEALLGAGRIGEAKAVAFAEAGGTTRERMLARCLQVRIFQAMDKADLGNPLLLELRELQKSEPGIERAIRRDIERAERAVLGVAAVKPPDNPETAWLERMAGEWRRVAFRPREGVGGLEWFEGNLRIELGEQPGEIVIVDGEGEKGCGSLSVRLGAEGNCVGELKGRAFRGAFDSAAQAFTLQGMDLSPAGETLQLEIRVRLVDDDAMVMQMGVPGGGRVLWTAMCTKTSSEMLTSVDLK